VGERVRAVVGNGGLRPIFAVQTHRSTLALARETAPLAEVALDETRILLGPGKEPARLRRVEVEAQTASPAELEALVAALQAGCGLQPAALSKYEAGLAAHDLKPAPPPELGSDAVQDSFMLGELAWAVMRRNWAAFLAHEPGARLGEDPEGVHAMRVASRRLRAALSLFADCLPTRAARFSAELKWVAAALGEVRDVDVQLERIQKWQTEADPADGAALAPLQALLEAQRGRARKRLLAALNSHRYARFAGAYTAMLQSGAPKRVRRPVARLPVLEVAPSLVADRYDQARKAGDGLADASPSLAYHALRIRGKRLRYALEFMTGVYGEPARELARKVTALQDVLGLLQDAQVATAQMRALSAAHSRRLPPETLFAMGEIAQRYAQSAADCRKRFPAVYAGVRGKSWKKLRQAMAARLAQLAETENPASDA
jgi:triphosphatase